MFKKLFAFLAAMSFAVAFAAVDANKGTAAELDGIKGIGPVVSAKIIDERKKGDFKDWNDFIVRVKGVGDKNAVKFSAEGLTVGGASFKGVAPAAKKTDVKPAAAAAAPAATPAAAEPAMTAKEAKKAKADEAKAKAAEAKAKKAADKAEKKTADAAKPAASAAKK